jgi:cell division protein FtsB
VIDSTSLIDSLLPVKDVITKQVSDLHKKLDTIKESAKKQLNLDSERDEDVIKFVNKYQSKQRTTSLRVYFANLVEHMYVMR